MKNINLFPGGSPYAGLYNINFGINPADKVLDIGGGNKPFKYSTHIIDKTDNSIQRHGREMVIDGKVFFDGDALKTLKTFPDKYFDFIYTSHTLEHIENLPPVLDEMSRVGKRGFNAFPASDFEFMTAKKHFGHVNLLRVINNVIHIANRPQNTIINEMGELFQAKLFTDPAFNQMWEGHNLKGFRFIWEARMIWQDKIDYIFHENAEDIYPQLKYFEAQ